MEKGFSILFIILGILSFSYYGVVWWMSFSKFWIIMGVAFFCVSIYIFMRSKGLVNIHINKTFKISLSMSILFLFSTFLIFETIIISKSVYNKMEKADYLIVLGAGLRGSTMSKMLSDRMEKALEYLSLYPDTKVIVSGGKGPDEDISEAKAMKAYLIEKGIKEEKIIMEDKSTSTMENLIYSKDILDKIENIKIDEVALITNGFHVYRAEFLAKRVGLDVKGIAAKSYIYAAPNFYVREYFAFIKSVIFDKV
ncbi:YdcF family protein [Clostridium sediminicola]|uniref:YdcF family protein n=1 Tax=Clostridium sediminicola TaxID=3114879 RepID=UPI0031F1D16E